MDISALREKLDRIDSQMLALLDERVALARDISSAKRATGLPLRDADREHQMIGAARAGEYDTLRPHEAVAFLELCLSFTRQCVHQRDCECEPRSIAIVGLGLIGGSLAMALKQAQPAHKLYGVDVDGRLDAPRNSGLFHELWPADQGAEAVKHADVVFLCTPLARTLELLETLAQDVPKHATVTDVAGVKTTIANSAAATFNFPDAPYFVGGHPMAGKARFGFENADAMLFAGRPWILTPASGDPVSKLNTLRTLIESTGATLQLMLPESHDRTIACASHLPQLAATALMLTVGDRANAIAGPGLRDMTRLASSPGTMWSELMRQVRPQLIAELQTFKAYLTELEMAVQFGEPLDKWFNRANHLRAGLEGVANNAPGA
ncbi:MAG: bifunctional chorismate mutase/prephenate dehydrogenase [Planctomycetes bacterium]|nr:bifunctional chorismate mutase/prephenate dehydrogenase [Planctomycetota bacterium]